MRTYLKLYFLILISLSGNLNAQSLDDYLKMAAENNPGLKAKYSEFEASMQTVAQAKSLPDPTLSFGYFISPVETRVGPQIAKFNLSQMFPWFGMLSTKGEIATLTAESKYQEFLNAKNELYYKVKAAWYPLVELQTIIQLQKANRDIFFTHKQLATTSFKNGKSSMTDVLRVDIMIESLNTDIAILEDKKKPISTYFNQLLNREVTTSIIIADSLSVQLIENDYRKDSLLKANPLLTAFDLKLKSAQAHEELARKQGLPKFGVGLDYVIVGERTDMSVSDNGKDIIMPMVSVSLPIFRGKYKASVKESQFMQESVKLYKEEYENSLVSNYDMTWYELNRANKSIELFNTQILKSEQILTLLLSAYSNSGKDFEEVLRLQQEILKYQIAKTTSLKDYYTSLAKLDYITAKSE